MVPWIKDVLGIKPQPEHSPVEYLNQLSSGEQRQLHGLWTYLQAHRADLEGVDFSIALVGGFARAFDTRPLRRRPTLKDVDIAIATSVEPNSEQERRVVVTADRLLRDYLTEQGILDEQLAGPDWQMEYGSYSSVKVKTIKGRYSSPDLRFITNADSAQQIRPFDIQFAGIGEPNMFQQPNLPVRKNKPYVVVYSTIQ